MRFYVVYGCVVALTKILFNKAQLKYFLKKTPDSYNSKNTGTLKEMKTLLYTSRKIHPLPPPKRKGKKKLFVCPCIKTCAKKCSQPLYFISKN